MLNNAKDILNKIALTPKGKQRACLLEDDNLRKMVLSSGANVTLYSGKPHSAATAKQALEDVYIGLILRKNKKGKLDGLGALGGLAERTDEAEFSQLSQIEKLKLIGNKDDVIFEKTDPVLTKDINLIRKNNVLREMREELDDLGIHNRSIDPDKLELILMPKVKDDNYMINIWDGTGECFAITPYCHIYEDKEGLIDEISKQAKEKDNGEAVTYKKMSLFEALSAFGSPVENNLTLEDGRSADKDYRYPHEYLCAWALAAKLLEYQPQRMVALAQEVQESVLHPVSFERIAKASGQSMEDIADVLHLKPLDLQKMEHTMAHIYRMKISHHTFDKGAER